MSVVGVQHIPGIKRQMASIPPGYQELLEDCRVQNAHRRYLSTNILQTVFWIRIHVDAKLSAVSGEKFREGIGTSSLGSDSFNKKFKEYRRWYRI